MRSKKSSHCSRFLQQTQCPRYNILFQISVVFCSRTKRRNPEDLKSVEAVRAPCCAESWGHWTFFHQRPMGTNESKLRNGHYIQAAWW